MSEGELHEAGSKDESGPSKDDHGNLPSNAKVIGHNTTSSGTTYGVVGHTDATAGWGLYTPDDALIDETLQTDYIESGNANLDLVTGEDSNGRAYNIVAGASANGGLAAGAVIAGGGFDDGTTSEPNEVVGYYPTISGGRNNYIGNINGGWSTIGGGRSNEVAPDGNETDYATIGGGRGNTVRDNNMYGTIAGGQQNTVKGDGDHHQTIGGGESNVVQNNYSTVGGGWNNEATAVLATVPGGLDNHADGYCSFAAGRYADANHDGTFVFGDSTTNRISTSNEDEARFQVPIYAPNLNNTSARAAKTNVEPVEPEAMLDGVESLEVSTWELEAGDDARHVGPMAEDFAETFELENSDDETIATVDADGVAFAAIQGLSQKLDEKTETIEELEAENGRKDERIEELEDRLDSLEARFEDHEVDE